MCVKGHGCMRQTRICLYCNKSDNVFLATLGWSRQNYPWVGLSSSVPQLGVAGSSTRVVGTNHRLCCRGASRGQRGGQCWDGRILAGSCLVACRDVCIYVYVCVCLHVSHTYVMLVPEYGSRMSMDEYGSRPGKNAWRSFLR